MATLAVLKAALPKLLFLESRPLAPMLEPGLDAFLAMLPVASPATNALNVQLNHHRRRER